MRESKFLAELVHSLKSDGAWCYKIPDTPTSMVLGLRYTPEKPSDIIGCYNGKFFAIEGKQIKQYKAFGMNAMRPSQISNLNDIIAKGGRGFVFLNIRIKGVKGETKQENKLVIFDWKDFSKLQESIKKRDVENLPCIFGSKGQFDLSVFLRTL